MFDHILTWYQANKETILPVAALLVIGVPLLKFASFLLKKSLNRNFSEQKKMIFSKGFLYLGNGLIVVLVFHFLGFKFTTLLGAAGVMGIAIGFAAQTSLSNLISGIFLIWEQPFQIGDLIKADQQQGVVHSIGLLSIQLRTFDNQLIRIPNESIIKNPLVNITRFPIRRMDLNIGVAYKEDIQKVMDILKSVADDNPYCLEQPEPVIIFKGFGESALELLFAPWFAKQDFILLRNSILKEIKNKFDEENIEIPFPHRTVYSGTATAPFPITIVNPETAFETRITKPDSTSESRPRSEGE
ncbi:MAG: mechanosensitive ion channel family protein [Lentisphaeria bacterium]|nr:mechanosensitive ion channel family protein [Lentisphaeria bacterium]